MGYESSSNLKKAGAGGCLLRFFRERGIMNGSLRLWMRCAMGRAVCEGNVWRMFAVVFLALALWSEGGEQQHKNPKNKNTAGRDLCSCGKSYGVCA